MKFQKLFNKRPKKSLLKKADFSCTEESYLDKNGSTITYKDYHARGNVWDKEIHICFSEDTIENLDDFVNQLNKRLDQITESKERIEQEILAQFFTLRNETWVEDDNDIVSEQEFIQRITPEDLTLSSDLSYDLRFNDGDLFWGHTIVYHGNVSNNCDGIGLEG